MVEDLSSTDRCLKKSSMMRINKKGNRNAWLEAGAFLAGLYHNVKLIVCEKNCGLLIYVQHKKTISKYKKSRLALEIKC